MLINQFDYSCVHQVTVWCSAVAFVFLKWLWGTLFDITCSVWQMESGKNLQELQLQQKSYLQQLLQQIQQQGRQQFLLLQSMLQQLHQQIRIQQALEQLPPSLRQEPQQQEHPEPQKGVKQLQQDDLHYQQQLLQMVQERCDLLQKQLLLHQQVLQAPQEQEKQLQQLGKDKHNFLQAVQTNNWIRN